MGKALVWSPEPQEINKQIKFRNVFKPYSNRKDFWRIYLLRYPVCREASTASGMGRRHNEENPWFGKGHKGESPMEEKLQWRRLQDATDSLCRGGAKVLQGPGRMCWDLMEPGRREELQWRRSHCGFISPGNQPALRLWYCWPSFALVSGPLGICNFRVSYGRWH